MKVNVWKKHKTKGSREKQGLFIIVKKKDNQEHVTTVKPYNKPVYRAYKQMK